MCSRETWANLSPEAPVMKAVKDVKDVDMVAPSSGWSCQSRFKVKTRSSRNKAGIIKDGTLWLCQNSY